MSIIPFPGHGSQVVRNDPMATFSIEVMPRTAAKIESFSALLPAGTRIYIAHLDGTPFSDMLATARRLTDEGFPVMPHIPARIVKDTSVLEDWLRAYRDDAGIDQALVLAGGIGQPQGAFESSIQLLETGLFDAFGFTRLHVAGHPEGNRDIDPDGTTQMVDDAARWKQDFAERTDAQMALVTQFAFEAKPIVDWAARYAASGIDLPIHVGIAGPAKLQTLLKFAIACGVGPSLRVLQKRARDVTKLLKPIEPTALLADLAAQLRTGPPTHIEQLHVFPLGGIPASAEYMANAQSDIRAQQFKG